jgi:dTMP kinase
MPFITLEGIEGSGKSTQLGLLERAWGPGLLLTQEPGGTPIGSEIRETLLRRRPERMAATAELLLYFADRAQHVEEKIRPALERGLTVVSDRYVDSTRAYQGYGRGLPLETIDTLWRIATGGLVPDLTLLLDVGVEQGLARVGKRGGEDRLESERREFHERVRAGYHALAAAEPRRWAVIDASGDALVIHGRIVAELAWRGLRPTEWHAVR